MGNDDIKGATARRTAMVTGATGAIGGAIAKLLAEEPSTEVVLACRNEGLGCVLTTLLCMEEERVSPLLGIPDGWYTCAHVPIGYPVGGGHGPISRRSVREMVFWDRFPAER